MTWQGVRKSELASSSQVSERAVRQAAGHRRVNQRSWRSERYDVPVTLFVLIGAVTLDMIRLVLHSVWTSIGLSPRLTCHQGKSTTRVKRDFASTRVSVRHLSPPSLVRATWCLAQYPSYCPIHRSITSRNGETFSELILHRRSVRVFTNPASRSTRRCFMTPNRDSSGKA